MEKFKYQSFYLRKCADLCLQNQKDPKVCEAEVIKIGKKVLGDVIKEL